MMEPQRFGVKMQWLVEKRRTQQAGVKLEAAIAPNPAELINGN